MTSVSVLRARQAAPPWILLVTSAFHLPRARLLFEHAGLSVIAFPVDFSYTQTGAVSLLDLLPSARALSWTQTAMREMCGRLFYRFLSP